MSNVGSCDVNRSVADLPKQCSEERKGGGAEYTRLLVVPSPAFPLRDVGVVQDAQKLTHLDVVVVCA